MALTSDSNAPVSSAEAYSRAHVRKTLQARSTLVHGELFCQVQLCGSSVSVQRVWREELVVAAGTGGHRRDLVPELLDNLESHDAPVYLIRLAAMIVDLPAGESRSHETR
jgi:hypothetical protein